jgi:hypothetical protein
MPEKQLHKRLLWKSDTSWKVFLILKFSRFTEPRRKMSPTRKESDLMNNLYLQERLVEMKQQEIQREVEQARLLREAGLVGPNLLVRAGNALRSFINSRSKASQDHASTEQPSYQSLTD